MKIKKVIYIFSAGVLGFLLHVLLHVLIEVLYLRSLESKGVTPSWTELFNGKLEALPLWVVITLAIVGTAFGVYLGFVWWKIVYIEKRHWKFTDKASE